MEQEQKPINEKLNQQINADPDKITKKQAAIEIIKARTTNNTILIMGIIGFLFSAFAVYTFSDTIASTICMVVMSILLFGVIKNNRAIIYLKETYM